MKKFEISNLIISRIHDISFYKLKKHSSARAMSDHSALIIRQAGSSIYTIDKKELSVDMNNALFIPAGVEYSLDVEKYGGCTIIEFDAANPAEELTPALFFVGGDKEIAKKIAGVYNFWMLKGPAYHSKCLSEIYDVITRISNENA